MTRTLIDHSRADPAAPPPAVDGSPLQVLPNSLTLAAVQEHLRAVAALSDAVVSAYRALAVAGGVLVPLLILGLVTRRYRVPAVLLTWGTVLPAGLMLTGAVEWDRSPRPALVLGLTILAWAVLLTGAALLLARRLGVPAAIVGAGLSVAAFTVDAALGGVMQPGSVLNSRPVFALRWYGFGNVTFAAYAAATLVLAGYVAARFRASGRRTAALVTVAAIGFGGVICEGWPTMGADFGGVLALTPAVLGLLLALSGVRVTVPRLLGLVAAGGVAVAAVSVLDWFRGPDARSHLGDFVQRILDGDALDVVARKAVASYGTVASLTGVLALVLGITAWVAILRFAVPRLRDAFPTLRPVALAVLAVAVLGTVVNDGGISVWITATAAMTVTVAWFGVQDLRATRPARR